MTWTLVEPLRETIDPPFTSCGDDVTLPPDTVIKKGASAP